MSQTDPALILPISDIDLSRDETRKLRLAGHVTAISPHNAALIVLSDSAASVLVDLSLCTDSAWSRNQAAPELKSMIMVIGHLTRRSLPLDLGFLTSPQAKDRKQVQLRDSVSTKHVPNRFFILEAILLKPLPPTFDLNLWTHTARLRSDHQWKAHLHLAPDKQGKRKASVID